MSDKNIKYRWYQNWKRAKDRVREMLRVKDFANAFYWEDVAQKIEDGFFSRFDQRLGAFLASI